MSKGINSLRKETNRLLSKGMSNINLLTQISHADIIGFSKTSCCNLKIKGIGAKQCVPFL